MWLRMVIGGGRTGQFPRLIIDVVMALAWSIDAIGPMQTGIEPLGRIGRSALGRQHVADFVVKGAGVCLGIEIATFPAPIGPCSCQTMKHLPRACLTSGPRRRIGNCCLLFLIGNLAPKKRRDVIFLNRFQISGNSGPTKIFLCHDIAGNLAPAFRDIYPLLPEHHGPVRIADFAGGRPECDSLIWRLAFGGEKSTYFHDYSPVPAALRPDKPRPLPESRCARPVRHSPIN